MANASFGDILKYISILEPLISDAQVAFGTGSGAEKKAAVIDGFTRSLRAGAPSLELSHPRYAAMIALAVQFVYDELKAWGELPAAPAAAPVPPVPLPVVPLPTPPATPPAVPPVVPAPPAPPSGDPTVDEYATLDLARAALRPGYPNVIRRITGTYSIWPSIGPFPGELVFP